jgi:Ca2+-binding EF-hand superfamily protein
LMAFDANGDGKLSRSELPERFQGLFTRGDTNGDGFLTPDEIRKMAAAQAPPPESVRPGGRGPEGRPGEGPRGNMNFIRMDPILAAIDSNGDGILSADEIRDSAISLRKLDKDSDGTVTREEAARKPGLQEKEKQ